MRKESALSRVHAEQSSAAQCSVGGMEGEAKQWDAHTPTTSFSTFITIPPLHAHDSNINVHISPTLL